MAFTIKEVTVISLSAVGTNVVTNMIPNSLKNTTIVVEVVGGLVTAQFARRSTIKSIGVGVFMGALISYVNGVLGVCKSRFGVNAGYPVSPEYPIGYSNNINKNYCPSCNKK